MSRRKNRRRRKSSNGQDDRDKPKSPSRRRFVKGLAIALGAAAIPTSVYFGSRLFHDDKWDFLARNEWHQVELDWKIVIGRYVPIGPEIQIKNSPVLEEIKKSVNPFLDHEIKIRGFDLPGDYDVKAYRQMFGVPDEKEFREPAMNYCKTAIEYLYNHPKISGLKKPSLDWIVINQGSTHEKRFNEKCFIGNSYYELQKVKVVNKLNPEQNFIYGRAEHSCNSRFVVAERNEDGSLSSWFIYVSAVEPHVLLFAPFSEVIPLTIDEATIRYEDEVGTKKATQAGETISEGLSHLLALELSDELGIPDGKKLARGSINKVRNYEMYKYLPNSVAWIRKNSMQSALDLYMESAKKFMEAIMKL